MLPTDAAVWFKETDLNNLKKSDEIKYAIEKGILLINAESENEVMEAIKKFDETLSNLDI